MRSLGLTLAAIVPLAACAADPNHGGGGGGTYNYQDTATTTVYGLPADYLFQVSANSTNGMDGDWTAAVSPGTTNPITVSANPFRTRAHALDFTGKTWIKMVITAAPANESANGVQIGEIDVHDIY